MVASFFIYAATAGAPSQKQKGPPMIELLEQEQEKQKRREQEQKKQERKLREQKQKRSAQASKRGRRSTAARPAEAPPKPNQENKDPEDGPPNKPLTFLSKRQVLDRLPVSGPTLWHWSRTGKFPCPRSIGNRTFWVADEVDEWMRAQPLRKYKTVEGA